VMEIFDNLLVKVIKLIKDRRVDLGLKICRRRLKKCQL